MSALDKAKNAVEDIEGKAKEVFGKVTGHEDTEAEGKKDQAREHFTTAKQMVEEMGYGRRTPEIADLEKQLGG